jgi:alpha-L-rhamnosidase
MDRREFLKLGAATVAAGQIQEIPSYALAPAWNAQWIWYPGQLAAYRHSRRIRLAMERCTNVGYPANFRQPQTEAYFRRIGTAAEDTSLRWAAPVARVRASVGGRSGDVTLRQSVLPKGKSDILVQIDFAQSLPCLLLEGGDFSTGAQWEASLDGEHWVTAEVGGGNDPRVLPDAAREAIVTLPVSRVIQPAGPPQAAYKFAAGHDLLLDFRETELGALRLAVSGKGELNIQVGESIPEIGDPDPRYFEQFPLQSIKLTTETQRLTLPQRALRFARLSVSGEAHVQEVRFDASLWPAEEKGTFESSDEDLNAIWKTAVATLRSNMHDFYLDGIRRDGLLWHDGPLTLEAYERVFFDADLSRQTLIGETLPERPTIRDIGIIDAPMYDLVGFEREYMVRGDANFSRMFRDRIEDILRFYESLQDNEGFVNAAHVEPYGFFPDWSATAETGPDGHGTPAYGQMLLSAAFAAVERLAHAWDDTVFESRCNQAVALLNASIRRAFWRTEAGLFANGLDRAGKPDERFTSFAQAFAIAYGIARPEEYGTLLRFLEDPSKRPAHYSLSQVVELTAFARAGRADAAIERLKSAWLPIIRSGYHRFFEDIDPAKAESAQLAMYSRKYATSLCHAWAGAAPVMAISRGLLGIEPVEPGYRLCSVVPQRCGLEWAKGTVPTAHGLIEVEWKGQIGEIRIPAGIAIRVGNNDLLNGPARHPLKTGAGGDFQL